MTWFYYFPNLHICFYVEFASSLDHYCSWDTHIICATLSYLTSLFYHLECCPQAIYLTFIHKLIINTLGYLGLAASSSQPYHKWINWLHLCSYFSSGVDLLCKSVRSSFSIWNLKDRTQLSLAITPARPAALSIAHWPLHHLTHLNALIFLLALPFPEQEMHTLQGFVLTYGSLTICTTMD